MRNSYSLWRTWGNILSWGCSLFIDTRATISPAKMYQIFQECTLTRLTIFNSWLLSLKAIFIFLHNQVLNSPQWNINRDKCVLGKFLANVCCYRPACCKNATLREETMVLFVGLWILLRKMSVITFKVNCRVCLAFLILYMVPTRVSIPSRNWN